MPGIIGATSEPMKTGTKKRNTKTYPSVFVPEAIGVSDDKYTEYIKEHQAKLRRLKREQSGLNMVEPE